MNEIQKIQLNLLLKLDEECRKHGLKYYLAYGSCIGAMRHMGFIPWDHDIDVLMPIDDALKLVEYQNEFGKRYFVSNYKTDKSFKSINMRLIDRNNRCIVRKNNKIVEEGYVCIDIYIFYNCPPTRIGLLLNIWRSHIYKILVGGIPKNHGKFAAFIAKIILILSSKGDREDSLRRIEEKLCYKGKSFEIADYYGLDITWCSAIKYKKEWFGEPKELLFEGHKFYGPTNPHEYLTMRYGDYMTPPSKETIKNEMVVELIK